MGCFAVCVRARVTVGVVQVLEFLEAAAATGVPAFSPRFSMAINKARWQERLKRVKRSCALLIQHGGSQYDGRDVNAGTVFRVLTSRPRFPGDAVVPSDGSCGSLIFAVYSHGWSYAVGDEAMQARLRRSYLCDTCCEFHTKPLQAYDHQHESAFTREWYVNMPYKCHQDDVAELYASVATDGHEHAHWHLYWQTLFRAYFHLVRSQPRRPILALHNFCGSGGTLKFMQRPVYQQYYGVDKW